MLFLQLYIFRKLKFKIMFNILCICILCFVMQRERGGGRVVHYDFI